MTLEIQFVCAPQRAVHPLQTLSGLSAQQAASVEFGRQLKAFAVANEGSFRTSRLPRRLEQPGASHLIDVATHFELLPVAAFATKAAATAFLTVATVAIRQWLKNQGAKSIVIKTPRVTLTVKGTASIEDALKAIDRLTDEELLPTTRAKRRQNYKKTTKRKAGA